MKQTLYITKADIGKPLLSTISMEEYSGWTLLGTIEVEFEVPEISQEEELARKIDSAYLRAAEIQTEADAKVLTVLTAAKGYKSQLKEYNTESTTGADEKELLAGGCEVIKTEYL